MAAKSSRLAPNELRSIQRRFEQHNHCRPKLSIVTHDLDHDLEKTGSIHVPRRRLKIFHNSRGARRIVSLLTALVFAIIIFLHTDALSRLDDDLELHYDARKSLFESPTSEDLAFLRSVLPVPCHSHNDYRRRTPLYAALASGCISVEADVWLVDDDLFIGHNTKSLNEKKTLKSMYLDPLERIMRVLNRNSQIGDASMGGKQGIFGLDPQQSLVMLVDFKTAGVETLEKLRQQLQSLRDAGRLTHWNGTQRVERAITIVASGYAQLDLIVAANETYRDIFLDAPLTSLASDEDPTESSDPSAFKYNPSNSWYASSDINKATGISLFFDMTDAQIKELAGFVRMAELRGLKSRYWGTPRWPRSFRDHIWEVLLQQGTSVLNVDDLKAMRRGFWRRWKKHVS